MLGAFIGDIAGSAYEFHNTNDYNCNLFPAGSNYTDDSVMTMAVASWLLKDPEHTHKVLEEEMVRFANEYPCPKGGYGGGFRRWLFHTADRKPYNSWGNGSAMRVSAAGWFFDTLEETERVAGISASITHNHPEGIKGAQATAAAIFLARTGRSKEEIKDYIESRFGYDLHKTYADWYGRYEWDESCQGTVPQALICFLESVDYEDAIRKAVALGGDSDTLACITGGIAEAYHGSIPGWMAGEAFKRMPEDFQALFDEVEKRSFYKRRIAVEGNPSRN